MSVELSRRVGLLMMSDAVYSAIDGPDTADEFRHAVETADRFEILPGWVKDVILAAEAEAPDPNWPRVEHRGTGEYVRGPHGVFAKAEDAAEPTDAQRAFATMPTTGLKSPAAQKWLAANAERYRSDPEFRKLVAATSAYVQGGYEEIRGAAEYALTGVMPASNFMNPQAWEGYLTGQPWRNDFGPAPEGAVEGTIVSAPIYPGVESLAEHTTDYYVQNGRLMSRDEYPAPTFKIESDIMAYSTPDGDSDNPAQQQPPLESVSYQDAGSSLNQAIANAPTVDELYRGLRLNNPLNAGRDATFTLSGDGQTLMAPPTNNWDADGHLIEATPGKPYLTVGQTLDMLGPTSFTSSAAIAERISSGRAQMGDNKPSAGDAALVIKVGPVNAVNVSALSPYAQAEYLTSGRFTVESITKDWVKPGYDSGVGRWQRKDSIPLYTVTLNQEGPWKP